MKISNFTSLARVVDPRYPTNLAIIVLSTIAGGALFLLKIYQGVDFSTSIVSTAVLALTVFLTWALGREIDPEHELAAFAGLFLVIPGYLFFPAPNLIAVFTTLLLLRFLIRTTGLTPKFLDSIAISGFGIWLVFRGDWIFGFLTAAVLFLDTRLSGPKKTNLYFSGIVFILTIISLFILEPAALRLEILSAELFFVIGVILLFIPLIVHSRGTQVVCDFPREKIDPLRLQTGQIFAIISATIVWLFQGRNGIFDLIPVWSSIIALSITYLATTLLNKIGKTRKRN